ncbi:MAG: SDR family oxidoreductase [Bacteroidales bacterium]|nr:SDR family oxidoreductase [Bacteroidales bacterium]
MNVLITGGAGYIGTELVKALNKNPKIDEIVIYDNLWKDQYNLFIHSGIKKGKVRFVRAEILDSRQLASALKGIDIVYHLAAHVDSKLVNANHHLYEQINNWGNAELSYAIDDSRVKTVINASSIAVYGSEPERINEINNPHPKTFYGTSKLRGEAHLMRLQDNRKVLNLRIGNVYGYGTSLRVDSFINQFAFSAAFENRIKIMGSGDQKRGIIHIDSLIDILSEIPFSNIETGTYNVLEQSLSVSDVADEFKKLIPEMEMLFINQHLDLRNIDVAPNASVNRLIKKDRSQLGLQLNEFIEHLFSSK